MEGFNYGQGSPQKKRRVESDDCQIEIKKTASGRKIKFRGKCSKEQIEIAREEANLKELED